MDSKWYALWTKAHREFAVSDLVAAMGVEFFLPALTVKPVNPRSATRRAFFPSYLFVCADLDRLGRQRFDRLQGSRGLVGFGGDPVALEPGFVRTVADAVDAINAASDVNRLQRGDKVKIVAGPLAGYEAVFDLSLTANDRVRVLLDVIGHVRLNSADIERL